MSRATQTMFSLRLNYDSGTGGTNVTTAAFVEISAAITTDVREVEIFDSSGQTMILAYGPAGFEVESMKVIPGGNPVESCLLNKGMRLSLKAVSGTADSGEFTANFKR